MPPGFWPIWTTVALDLVGFGIVAPILGRYAERFGASGFEVGMLFASFSLAQVVLAPVLGRLSDRIGRKPVIILSLVGTAVGSFITGAAGALWVLFLGRILDGASGASVAVAQGAVADIAPPEDRARLQGMLGAAFGLGFVLGPAIGGLAALGGPHVPFFVAGTVAAVNAVVAFRRLPETRPVREQVVATGASASPAGTEPDADAGSPVRSPVLVRYAVTAFIVTVGFAGVESTFSLFGERRFDLTEGSTALVFLFIGLLLVLVQGRLIGPGTARWGSARLLRGGMVTVAAGLLLLSYATQWAMLVPAIVLLAVGQGFVSPTLTALVAAEAPPERRGEVLGWVQSSGAMARIVGPVSAGILFDVIGPGAPFLVGAVFYAVALAVVVGIDRQ
jgi:multidrug resistance protein